MSSGFKNGIPACLAVLVGVAVGATLGAPSFADDNVASWKQVAPGVLRSSGLPCSYALVEGNAAVLFGAAGGASADSLRSHGVEKIDLVLVTHHHRDSIANLAELLAAGAIARAPAASEPWISPSGVAAFWETALPRPSPPGRDPPLKERTFNDWVYLVLPTGVPGVDCSLRDGEQIDWKSWRITCLDTPGHSRDHMAFAAHKADEPDGPFIFCGDALSTSGRIPTPYTTDWEHWSGRGLQAAFQSLRKLAALSPTILCPEHGPPIRDQAAVALYETAMNAAEAAFLKSYERFTKERLGSPPAPAFLAKQQVVTAGDEPWTALTPHLFLTGNTFALASRDGPLMLFDAYGPRIVEQLRKLQADQNIGPLEVVTISHSHNDHYKGIYLLPKRNGFQVWAQARLAEPLLQPYRYCAPYLDARPLQIDRKIADGERVRWREYEFVVHHLPGQTDFSQGLEVVIDGKKCFFTGDSFYHADQFSGSGGWSGRNRGLPLPYAASAQKLLAAAPDWVLCEHGGAFTFDAEDFRRRAQWAEEAARAADALSPNGDHRRDWDPQRIRIEPLLQTVSAGGEAKFALVSDEPWPATAHLDISMSPVSGVEPWRKTLDVAAGAPLRHEFTVRVLAGAKPGRHVLTFAATQHGELEGSDTFCVIDITK